MKSLLVSAVSAGVLVATAGYASAQETPPPMKVQTGPDAEVTADGLYRVDNSLMALAYVKPDLSLQGYTKFMLDPVSVAYQKDPHGRTRSMGGAGQENFALSSYQMDNLKEWFQEEVTKALTEDEGYELVDAPAPDVLRLSAALMDLIIEVPTAMSGESRRGVTRSFGKVTLLVELRDSQSGEILARVGERRDISDDDRNTYTPISPSYAQADFRALFEFWAALMRARLDEIRTHAAGSEQ